LDTAPIPKWDVGMKSRIMTVVVAAALLAAVAAGWRMNAQRGHTPPAVVAETPYPVVAPEILHALEWRFIGPARGNRVSAVAGDPQNPNIFYYGGNGGGVFKSIDAGTYWEPMSDGFFKTGPVGAIAIADSNPEVIYVGMGDTCMRPDMASGDGVYKSVDAGRTWTHVGLEDTRHIAQIRVHPHDPNLVYVAAFGHAFGPNPERGVYRSKDGGTSWQRVLFKSDRAGAIDLTMDPSNPRVLYAAMYQFVRSPWDEISGGPDSGLYKTTDGGETWADISGRPGLPQGIKGRIGVAISPAKPSRIWALVEAEDGALFRSDDSGATWQRISDKRDIRRSPSSYMHVYPSPKDPEKLYILSYEAWQSSDGGRTFSSWPTTHGDNHDLWIDPRNPDRMIEGNDGGATVTMNGGVTWGPQLNQPSAAIYRIAVDNRFPYRVYGTQQDNMAISVPSRTNEAAILFKDSYQTAGSESGYIAVKPDNADIVVAGAYSSGPGGEGQMKLYDRRTDLAGGRVITVWPEDTYSSHSVKDMKFRFNWTFPIVFSPHDPNVLYVAANRILRSRDLGQTWDTISPDLTRNVMSVIPAVSGGPITSLGFAQTFTSVVFAFAESPIVSGELWAGTDDGLVQLSRNAGKTWSNITPPEWPQWLRINTLDLSRHDPGTAYIAANRYLMDDQQPYVFKTTDYGKTWKSISKGIGEHDFARVIREDPIRKGLLYLGTERGVHVSFDAGESWTSLQLNLPAVAVHDLLVKDNDVVIGTHSRGFWILDDVTPLRQITDAVARSDLHLFTVPATYRLLGTASGRGGREGGDVLAYGGDGVAFRNRPGPHGELQRRYLNAGENPSEGVVVTYYVRSVPARGVTLTFKDHTGRVIKQFSPANESSDYMRAEPGTNRFVWNMRYPNARELSPGAALSTMEWARATAPVAAPGTYTVQLDAGGVSRHETFEIRKDPRLSWTDADLVAQFELWLKVRDALSGSTDTVQRLREFRRRRDESRRTDAIEDATAAKLNAIEASLTRVVGRNPMHLPPKGLNQKLATLTNIIGSADGKPTRWMYAVFDELSAELARDQQQLDALIGSTSGDAATASRSTPIPR
jgi:photosystem II stability/assembly factor-like uncharacterized protein